MTIKLSLLAAAALVWTSPVFAHCDTLDGPVVLAARKALDSGELSRVLVWVQKDVEAGRAYASAYVEFVHYAERLYEAAETMAPDAAHKH
jgi:hypothetical protein